MAHLTRRDFLRSGLAAGAAFSAMPALVRAAANDEVNLGFISCGGRANQLMSAFEKVEGVTVGGLCDPDEGRLGKTNERFPRAKAWKDLRELIDDDSIDAVVVATCNHWHCLAAIWAMEAGKDVYVEKPLSHSEWEGRQTVAAARKYNRICQVGTQQRSDPMQDEIKKFLHEEQPLGRILSARVNRYGVRAPIGKRESPLQIDSSIDYDLWLGPAQDEPIYRENLQYDWHWDWNTGSGEMGNWGVHVLDDVRNNVVRDQVTLPRRIFGGGGRIAWEDAGETPNVHFVFFDTGTVPIVIGLSNLPETPDGRRPAPHPGPGSGYIAYCEGGRFEGQRGRGAAFDSDGRLVREFKGNSGDVLHQQNFIDAVRSHKVEDLNADVEVGHHSTGWCNLANIAVRTGTQYSHAAAREISGDQGIWESLLAEMQAHVAEHGTKMDEGEILLSPMLEFDPQNERFVGENAEKANAFLKREYRQGYEVPQIA